MHAKYLEPDQAALWFAFGCCLRLGFFALLSPQEPYSRTRRCLQLPFNNLLLSSPVGACKILDPENRAFMGRLQVRMFRDKVTIAWLQWYAAGMVPCQKLWPHSPITFSERLKVCSQFFGSVHLGFTPASMRAGGATYLLESGESLGNSRFMGSWASERSMACTGS